MTKEIPYLEDIKKIDLEISESAVGHLASVMRRDLWRPATREEIKRSHKWINRRAKRCLEKAFALVVVKMRGDYLVEWIRKKIEKIDGEDGYYYWEVGFFSLPENLTVESHKIRTMRPGAEDELSSPFQHTTFRKNSEDPRESAVLPGRLPKLLRRSGLDGLTEIVVGIREGDWDLVGARPINTHELEGVRILHEHRRALSQEGLLSPEVSDLLGKYPNQVSVLQPRPAIFGPLASFQEDVGHITRMFGDMAYWQRTDPIADFRLLSESIRQRVIGGVGAK